MTIPSERSRAVRAAEEFLVDLITPSQTRGVPRLIRLRALRILRHYPSPVDMNRAATFAPAIFSVSDCMLRKPR